MKRISYNKGSVVSYKDRDYEIVQALDTETILARRIDNGHPERIKLSDVTLPDSVKPNKATNKDLLVIDEKKWGIAKRRYKAIKSLIGKNRTRDEVQKCAEAAGVSLMTIYRWIKMFEDNGDLSGLLPAGLNGGKGKSRLNEDTEQIIQDVLSSYYLSKQKYSVQQTYTEIKRRCKLSGISPPHPNTVRNRVNNISERARLKHREGTKQADETFEPSRGKFPGGNFPLDVVQIDHTKVDLILVDDISRQPIGRPWITVAIDIFSRMITGLHISFDPPSAVSVGLCIKNCILPKEEYLAKLEIETKWPVWGFMVTVHADNAKEFRSNILTKACDKHGINLEWRPVARPHYGAHVERLIGTSMKNVHALPGTTFSNIREKGEYQSEKRAALTLAEFEKWLVTWITGVYHQKIHSTLDMPPLKKWELGIFGTDEMPGTGLPARTIDDEGLSLDFMPYSKRTVQKYGILWDHISYFSNVLRVWVNAKDPDNPKFKRKFIVRRDPRDISVVFFYDPELEQYYPIPYRDTSRPAISLWEWKMAKKRLKDMGEAAVDEEEVFESYEKMRVIEDNAVKETKKVRRANQRRRMNKSALDVHTEKKQEDLYNEPEQDIVPFDDLEFED